MVEAVANGVDDVAMRTATVLENVFMISVRFKVVAVEVVYLLGAVLTRKLFGWFRSMLLLFYETSCPVVKASSGMS